MITWMLKTLDVKQNLLLVTSMFQNAWRKKSFPTTCLTKKPTLHELPIDALIFIPFDGAGRK